MVGLFNLEHTGTALVGLAPDLEVQSVLAPVSERFRRMQYPMRGALTVA